MKTVHEISALTGVSVRTLHYYDEIGLLKPTGHSAAGYRLYDDSALERLQQILFFREFDISLKQIRDILADPLLDRDRVLRIQRQMLVHRQRRTERLIAGIDGILKGENNMDFTIFDRTDLEALAQATLNHAPDFLNECLIRDFGSLEQWKRHYVERASREDMQKGYQKMVEWYGSRENALRAMTDPPSRELAAAYGKRFDAILGKLAGRMGQPADSFAVKEIVGEYGFVLKQFLQLADEREMMLAIADHCCSGRAKAAFDETYGSGMAEFFGAAVRSFYQA